MKRRSKMRRNCDLHVTDGKQSGDLLVEFTVRVVNLALMTPIYQLYHSLPNGVALLQRPDHE